MKTIVALVIVHFSLLSHALSPKDSWEKIFKAKQLSLFHAENLGNIELKNACFSGDFIRSILPFKKCKGDLEPVKAGENKDKYTDWRCKEWVVEHSWVPRTTAKIVCSEYVREGDNTVCSKYITIQKTVQPTVMVSVVTGFDMDSTYPGFQKPFTFPDCPQ